MRLIRLLRASRIAGELAEVRTLYARETSIEDVRRQQLESLRREWRRITTEVPHFFQLRRSGRIPDEIRDWKQFRDHVPVMGRGQLASMGGALCSASRAPDGTRCTGGSTAEPITLPVWNSEIRRARTHLWLGRSWFGVHPSDRLFLLWGHSHLFGSGFRGRGRRLARVLSDRLLGYHRFSAYDLSNAALKQAGDELLRFRPAYIVGYAVALDRFAQANPGRHAAFHRLRLKAAFATAESFPSGDSAQRLAHLLGCPVAMEYGAVETGPIAHQQPGSDYAVFWRDYLLEGIPSAHVPGSFELLVTSLVPRCVPLVRYRIGDLVSHDPWSDPRRIESVVGRCNDAIRLLSGTVVHSEAFTHALRDARGIAGFQVVQADSGTVRLDYVAPHPLPEATLAEIRRRLGLLDPELREMAMERVPALAQTIAGKTRRVRGRGTNAGAEGNR